MFGVMGANGFAIVSDGEVNFEDAVTELVIEEESFVGIGVRVTEDAAKGVSDIGADFGPPVVEVVGWL